MITVFEGIDGSGKSRQAGLLAESPAYPRQEPPLVLSFPRRDSVAGMAARAMLAYGGDGLALQALMSADRHAAAPMVEEMARRTDVILARWSMSIVYAMHEGIDRTWLHAIHSRLPRPDVQILLDLDADEAMRRVGSRGGGTDRYEAPETLRHVRALYLDEWAQKAEIRRTAVPGGALRQTWWQVVDASGTVEDVHARILAAMAAPRYVEMTRRLLEIREAAAKSGVADGAEDLEERLMAAMDDVFYRILPGDRADVDAEIQTFFASR